MEINLDKLEWDIKYSVGVTEIDNQHKELFKIVNHLITVVTANPTVENLIPVLDSLIEYKKFHFETEEKYFKEFNYDGAEEHIEKHKDFGRKLEVIQERNKDDKVTLTYELVDFLEDWLIDHLMTTDREYIECFAQHGLK